MAAIADPVPVHPPATVVIRLAQREPDARLLDVLMAWRTTGQVYPI